MKKLRETGRWASPYAVAGAVALLWATASLGEGTECVETYR